MLALKEDNSVQKSGAVAHRFSNFKQRWQKPAAALISFPFVFNLSGQFPFTQDPSFPPPPPPPLVLLVF
jgi:hypothetical protein